jgi:hypothetical protein
MAPTGGWPIASTGPIGRQALPMVWDYAESNPFAGMAGDPMVSLTNMMRVLDGLQSIVSGSIELKSLRNPSRTLPSSGHTEAGRTCSFSVSSWW